MSKSNPVSTLPLAAIDLGSNSFHMIIAEPFQSELRILEKRGVKVQLAAGLDQHQILSEDAIQKGLDCLQDFSHRLNGFKPEQVRVMGTNALRVAKNREEFITRASKFFPYPIEVIAGREEARLIYVGVSHTVADHGGKRVVFDIGGGSTECVLGRGFTPIILESLHMGCVSYTQRFFPGGLITEQQFLSAKIAAKRELFNIRPAFEEEGWKACIGSSGTVRAAETTAVANGWSQHHLCKVGLERLIDHCLNCDHVNEMDIHGLKPDRRPVFIGGLAILAAIFEVFDVEQMTYSDGALREGILWEMRGAHDTGDIRWRTIQSLQERYHVDRDHATRVANTASRLFDQLACTGQITMTHRPLLLWASHLHEIGLSLSHSGFHKHGAYIAEHSDLLGFTRHMQSRLAFLIRLHRRKINRDIIDAISVNDCASIVLLIRILRLAVILNLSRSDQHITHPLIDYHEGELILGIDAAWCESHPLTMGDLDDERHLQSQVGWTLTIHSYDGDT